MLQIPGNDSMVVVIEPANVKRMKEGKPLIIRLVGGQSVMVAFTPDMAALSRTLVGRDVNWPGPKEQLQVEVKLTPEKIDKALKACQNLPEVER